MPDPAGSKVLAIVAQSRFEDKELTTLQAFMERRKISFQVAAPTMRDVYGLNKTRVRPAFSYDDVKVEDFDVIVFIGGVGSREIWDDPKAHAIARNTIEAGKLLVAIGQAPIILARAGLLDGREATVYFSEKAQFTKFNIKYLSNPIVISDNIITVKGSEAIEPLALGLIKRLSEAKTA